MKVVTMVLIGMLLSMGASAEDPATVVQRTYGWWLVRQGQTNTYRPSPHADKQLLTHKGDFAPELLRLLKAINDMVAEYQAGRGQLTWDNDPLTWSDSALFEEPLKVRTASIHGNTAVVTITSTISGPRVEHVPVRWYVDLVKMGSHWQIANLRFPTEGSTYQINVLQELRKNFHQ